MNTAIDTYIHETALVSVEAKVGAGSKVWMNVQIREGAQIGEACIISKDVYIDTKVKIGNRCKIQNSVNIYRGVTIEDDVFVGPSACFTNDKIPRAFNSDWKVVETRVCSGASIGANATIVCGVTLGRYCMVAAGSVVTRDVPPFTLVAGCPAKPVGEIDEHGNLL